MLCNIQIDAWHKICYCIHIVSLHHCIYYLHNFDIKYQTIGYIIDIFVMLFLHLIKYELLLFYNSELLLQKLLPIEYLIGN